MASHVDRHPTELAGLRGARFVTVIETEENRRWAESRIKALTGGDPIAARYMRQDFFEFTPVFKLFVVGNHKPRLRTVDEAIRRRLYLIPFSVVIPKAERDLDLPDKLQAEWPGILSWAIEGAVEWHANGLQPPAIVTDATLEYLNSEDLISIWIEDRAHEEPNARRWPPNFITASRHGPRPAAKKPCRSAPSAWRWRPRASKRKRHAAAGSFMGCGYECDACDAYTTIAVTRARA